MEFHEKLQALRRQKGITQEELAQALYVSRAAVSKWESGRGSPSLDSLRDLARFFGVTVDALLSREALPVRTAANRTLQVLPDWAMLLCFVLPLFCRTAAGTVQAVSLLSLTGWVKSVCCGLTTAAAALGLLARARPRLQDLSLALHGALLLLLIAARQPYGAVFVLLLLGAKLYLRQKSR